MASFAAATGSLNPIFSITSKASTRELKEQGSYGSLKKLQYLTVTANSANIFLFMAIPAFFSLFIRWL